MNESVIPLHIPDPLLHAASRQAERAGLSIESWLLSVAEESVRESQVYERFFARSDEESARTLLEILDSVSDGAPLPGDELPEG